jgi:hypothetical protein
VLLACAPEDLHSLPLFALAAALAERRIGSRVLGARVPQSALVAAARRTGTHVVVISRMLGAPDEGPTLPDLSALRPLPQVLLAGPGWGAADRAAAGHVADLATAVASVAGRLGA